MKEYNIFLDQKKKSCQRIRRDGFLIFSTVMLRNSLAKVICLLDEGGGKCHPFSYYIYFFFSYKNDTVAVVYISFILYFQNLKSVYIYLSYCCVKKNSFVYSEYCEHNYV
jgi:hypothetical protein